MDDVRLLCPVKKWHWTGIALFGPHTCICWVYSHSSNMCEKMDNKCDSHQLCITTVKENSNNTSKILQMLYKHLQNKVQNIKWQQMIEKWTTIAQKRIFCVTNKVSSEEISCSNGWGKLQLSKPELTSRSIHHVTKHHWLCLLGLMETETEAESCLVWLEPIQRAHTTESLSSSAALTKS